LSLEEDKTLIELKTLYDELWSDAKTLVKDMNRSIYIYLYAGIVTLFVAVFGLTIVSPYFLAILLGSNNPLIWSYVVIELVAAIVVIWSGARLLIWYRRLKKRYSNLMEMERKWRKTDA
jgi:hypothetical protein